MLGAPLMLWALTGCSGSGATTVGSAWRDMGAAVCSLDRVGHRFLEKAEVKRVIQERTGIQSDPAMSVSQLRKLLREKTFTDEKTLRTVNSVMHPLLRRWTSLSAARLRDHPGVFVLDGALIFELGLERHCHFTVSVKDTRERAVERLMVRDGLSIEAATGRWNSQKSMEEKSLGSHFVIDNSGGLNELRDSSMNFYNKVMLRMEDARWRTRQGKS